MRATACVGEQDLHADLGRGKEKRSLDERIRAFPQANLRVRVTLARARKEGDRDSDAA